MSILAMQYVFRQFCKSIWSLLWHDDVQSHILIKNVVFTTDALNLFCSNDNSIIIGITVFIHNS